MLIQVDDDGTLHWVCPDCRAPQSAPVTAAQVEAVEVPGEFALPPCACAASGGYSRMTIRVVFSDAEVSPATLHYDSLGRIIQAEIPDGSKAVLRGHTERDAAGRLSLRRIDGVDWHPALLPHLVAAKHLAAVGKLDAALVRDGLPEHRHSYPETQHG